MDGWMRGDEIEDEAKGEKVTCRCFRIGVIAPFHHSKTRSAQFLRSSRGSGLYAVLDRLWGSGDEVLGL